MPPRLLPRFGYAVRASGVMARDPVAAAERVKGRLARRRDVRELSANGLSTDELYPIDADWLQHLHEALGAPWPCACEAEAESLYEEIMALFASKGLPARYAGWCDGGRTFTKAAWCLCLHLEPQVVVETGVARGVTSRFVLEALERRGAGSLSSVDLPSVDSRFHGQIGIAVPERLKGRWSYLRGTSRQRLPGLLDELGEIDLFIHDSLHTGSNTRFELESAWSVLRPGGAVIVDDVYTSLVFRDFVSAARPRWSCIAANPDGSYRFGIILRSGDLAELLQSRIPSAGPGD
jgi:hypothetical protein